MWAYRVTRSSWMRTIMKWYALISIPVFGLYIAVTLPWAVLITLNDPLHRLFPVRLRLVVPCVLAILGVCAAVVAGLSH